MDLARGTVSKKACWLIDVYKKKFQSGIFYLVTSQTFVGGLIVDSLRLKFHIADPTSEDLPNLLYSQPSLF